MKRFIIFLLSAILIGGGLLTLYFLFGSNNAIELRDAHESLSAGAKEQFSYAFAKGDTIIVRIQTTEGTLSEFKITSFPEEERFALADFKDKVEKKIVVDQTNCFTFSLSSTQGCKFHYTIARVPGANTPKQYNTEVHWADTEKEQEYIQFVNLTERPEFIGLCASSGKYLLTGCKDDRVTRTYDLPEGTRYCIYRLEVDNSKVDTQIKEHEDLYRQLNNSNLPTQAKLLGDVFDYLTTPPSSGYACDLYFLNSPLDAQVFKNHQPPWRYNTSLSKENTQSVCARVMNSSLNKRLYIGLRNNYDWKALKVQMQITAAVLKKVKLQKPIFQEFE